MPDTKREIRKHLLVMIALVLVIDAVAIGLFTTMGITQAPRDRKILFTGAWTLATLAVVMIGLYRIRVARNEARRRGS